MSWRIGVDIGGTFTDVAVVDEESGSIGAVKVPTTPRDFGEGVVAALNTAIARHDIDARAVGFLSHATTVVTNALLEEKGADIALLTTRGFRDILELRRSARGDLYDLFQDPPSVLVPRYRRLEITERLDAQGEVVTPLIEEEIDDIVAFLRAQKVQAVAVSLLYSFLNDAHERVIGERLRAGLPGVLVFLSSEVLPEIREFERTSTTAVCAYVGPILESYLRRLEKASSGMGLPPLHVMGSSGGVFSVAEGLKMPAMAVESGPAAGVIAAQLIGRQLGIGDLISFDMGGTTAKASLIENGTVETTAEYEVGSGANVSRWLHGTGHPIRVPVIDLAEVSAGGGSIAWIDPGGALRVGPRSAGAEPGPVCYGQGGVEPTVTDCDLLLGYLDPDALLGGDLEIDYTAAERAVTERIAEPLGLDVMEAAAGVIEVVNASMAEALRIVSVERGHDAREFSMVAFGGAGPVHAAALAAELEIPRVIVPPAPGAFSALGLVATDFRRDYGRTFFTTADAADLKAMDSIFETMEADAKAMLGEAGIAVSAQDLQRTIDCRYVRQAYELNVSLEAGKVTRKKLSALEAAFHARHKATYGHESPDEAVQLVNLRLVATGRLAALDLRRQTGNNGVAIGERKAYFRGHGSITVPVIDRDGLAAETALDGPVIISAPDTTILAPPGTRAQVDARGFIIIEVNGNG